MIDERMADAYEKDIERLKQENAKLKEENSYLKAEIKRCEVVLDRLKAQIEIVRLIFGSANR